MIIKLIELINPSNYKKTSEENMIISNKIKSIIVDTRIDRPQEEICLELISQKSPEANIINALAKSVISEWGDIECR